MGLFSSFSDQIISQTSAAGWRNALGLDAIYQSIDPDVTAVASSGLAAAWTAYTPTVTAAAGTFTAVSATGRHLTMGKLRFVQARIAITTVGTASGQVFFTLPGGTAAANYPLYGWETAVTGKMVTGLVSTGVNTATSIYYDNTTYAASGALVTCFLTYEIA